tara:strand:+ start:513 stop:977 length:465 start_codon:yes stop_codon:yes gene_type:complete
MAHGRHALFKTVQDSSLGNTPNHLDLVFTIDVGKLKRVEVRIDGTNANNSRECQFVIFIGQGQTTTKYYDGALDQYLPIDYLEATGDVGDAAVTVFDASGHEYAGWRRHQSGILFRGEMVVRITNPSGSAGATNVKHFAAEVEELISLPGGGFA